ncbi:MAG: hypothetical protein ONB48_03165 [candidate division KSB1 bacterium]|nr:hypothetical protein [candidate division KSB1 bacterium]MDZ7275662.1 hypothetical protein [candidate division KSB1 bacterium]MDZ7284647.1 hypothetical protein [candidate division KSB1 bacterium]MDZ7297934.1 hypothetical protein [candidate division KSB1 bacterium]MDZ7307101.1 hypothetical protein [candidate division KSB1 bacterium]
MAGFYHKRSWTLYFAPGLIPSASNAGLIAMASHPRDGKSHFVGGHFRWGKNRGAFGKGANFAVGAAPRLKKKFCLTSNGITDGILRTRHFFRATANRHAKPHGRTAMTTASGCAWLGDNGVAIGRGSHKGGSRF